MCTASGNINSSLRSRMGGEIQGADLKRAGKSRGQFNGYCFTQGGALRGRVLFFLRVMPAFSRC